MSQVVVAGALANEPRNSGEAWVRVSGDKFNTETVAS